VAQQIAETHARHVRFVALNLCDVIYVQQIAQQIAAHKWSLDGATLKFQYRHLM